MARPNDILDPPWKTVCVLNRPVSGSRGGMLRWTVRGMGAAPATARVAMFVSSSGPSRAASSSGGNVATTSFAMFFMEVHASATISLAFMGEGSPRSAASTSWSCSAHESRATCPRSSPSPGTVSRSMCLRKILSLRSYSAASAALSASSRCLASCSRAWASCCAARARCSRSSRCSGVRRSSASNVCCM